MVIRPLGLPAGSVRALLLLSLAVRAVLDLRADGQIEGWLTFSLVICAAAYFASRAAANVRKGPTPQEGSKVAQPLGLPAGVIRALFLAAVAYGAWLWFDHHGSGAESTPVAWILVAFLLGNFMRLLLQKLRIPEDPGARGADHLLALVSLIAGIALPVLAAMGKSGTMPAWTEPLLAAVVVHYFATRA